ncbi:DUF1223 domain-containing protein [Jannaschia sp. LMIT008]|uniref:DUF1223 domain-containing protein n=1 Tax=Jannaschia maritima TaxID=3032585 RepID=UPI002811CA5B|nr:DUF1223 domain-containing protein [Jannaschia sp. LMIT008]
MRLSDVTPRLAALAAATVLSFGPAQADPVVVELFTSQGCSSCPPADAILHELGGRTDVIPLAFHVDYWDWIGWADTFADPAFTQRQRDYAAAARSTMVYTPQFVVGGVDHVAGAKPMALRDKIEAHADAGAADVLSVRADGQLAMGDLGRPARLYLLHVEPRADVSILRGENAGHDATYAHVVRDWQDLGAWNGRAGAMELPPARDGLYRVILAQGWNADGTIGPIQGAVAVD